MIYLWRTVKEYNEDIAGQAETEENKYAQDGKGLIRPECRFDGASHIHPGKDVYQSDMPNPPNITKLD